MSESAGRPGRRRSAWTERARQYREKLRAYQERLERRPRVAFLLQVNRRFNQIEGKHLALVISLNLFVAVIPLKGFQKYLRGAAWLVLLLADTVIVLALRNLAASRPPWFTVASGVVLLVLEFVFYLISPRLLLELPFKWRDLVPGAAVCTGAAVIVHAVVFFFLRKWVAEYGHAYGGFGVSLALIAGIGIISSFWIWIAAVMGVYWERKAGPAAVAAMEKLSAEISATEEATASKTAAGIRPDAG